VDSSSSDEEVAHSAPGTPRQLGKIGKRKEDWTLLLLLEYYINIILSIFIWACWRQTMFNCG
jgi:hypothetical protein